MTKSWYFLKTRSRAEKKLQQWMTGRRIWNYLPLYVNERTVQRRKVRTEVPILPGYLLACMNATERLLVLKSNMVVLNIPIEHPRKVVHQLRQIVRAARSSVDLKPVTSVVKSGEMVKIKSGLLSGLEGRLVWRGDKYSLVVQLDALGAAFEVAVSAEDIG